MHIIIFCVIIIALANLPKAFYGAMMVITGALHAVFWLLVSAFCLGGLVWLM